MSKLQNICVGQTKSAFSTRWSGHRRIWNSNNIEKHNDRASLLIHYHTEHKHAKNSHPEFQVVLMLLFLRNLKTIANWISWKVIGSNAFMHRLILPKLFYPSFIDFFLHLQSFVLKFGFAKR